MALTILINGANGRMGKALAAAAKEEKEGLLVLATKVPCVWTGNFSVGLHLLFALTRRAMMSLRPDYDAKVIEMHYRFKKDAPSGTAARLLEIMLQERRLSADALRHGRQGITGERKSAGSASMRSGAAMSLATTRRFLQRSVSASNSRTKKEIVASSPAAHFAPRSGS